MNILCVLSLFASLLKYRLVIICMNVLVCVMAAKCRHLFSVLTSGPVTVGGQRGTCGVQRSKHRDVCIGLSGCVLVLY